MTLHHLYGFFLIFLIPGLLSSCTGGSKGEDQQKAEQVKEEKWHMSDEIRAGQVSAEEEEAFRMAAHDGNLERVKDLHSRGVACDAVDQEGHTALMYAAFNGHSEIVLYLLDCGAEIDRVDFLGRTALLYGATGPFPETVRILLDRGADPDMVDSQEHFSPLMHAAAEGNLEVVKVLIEYGADRTLRDVDGDDAASFASLGGHARVAEYLNSLED